LQTVPSLALLAFLIPLFGIGVLPALVALFVYSLLPIVRNTFTGLTSIPRSLDEAADAIGLSPLAKLSLVTVPMASPAIMAGIKTSAIINVGTGDGVTVRELVAAFEKVFGEEVPVNEAPPRPGDAVGAFANVDKARDVLGWTSELTIEDAIASALAWGRKLAQAVPLPIEVRPFADVR
jgi:hypothetical protein